MPSIDPAPTRIDLDLDRDSHLTASCFRSHHAHEFPRLVEELEGAMPDVTDNRGAVPHHGEINGHAELPRPLSRAAELVQNVPSAANTRTRNP